jgi:hypothetical protein
MSRRHALLLFALFAAPVPARSVAPIDDPVNLNIGLNCQWKQSCMFHQRRAMSHALKYLNKYHPPVSRIAQCNRNASRFGQRTDWIGFNNCVRNAAIVYVPPPPPPRHHAKRHRHKKRHSRRHHRR